MPKKIYISGVYYEQDEIDRKFFNQTLDISNRKPSIRIFEKRVYLDTVKLDGTGEDDKKCNRDDERTRYYYWKGQNRTYSSYFDKYNFDGSEK